MSRVWFFFGDGNRRSSVSRETLHVASHMLESIMTRNQLNAFLAAILETAHEMDAMGGAPEGPMYAAMMNHVDLATFESILGLAESASLVTRKAYQVRLTSKGREAVRAIQAGKAS